MSDSFQRVEPAPFDAPASPQAGARPVQDGAGRQPRWLWPTLALLLLLAAVVVFLLPQLVDGPGAGSGPAAPPQGTAAPAPGTPAASRRADAGSAPAGSPFADAQAARARSAAQEVLAELLDARETLGERGAGDWAGEAMAAIADTAGEGDTLYREREFDAALQRYETALERARELQASIPGRFEAATTAAGEAIEALDTQAAAAALRRAAQLQPQDAALPPLRARVDALPAVAAAVEAARAAEAGGDLEAAVAEMATAAELDRQHGRVAAQLERLRGALAEQRFSGAMSAGYAALDENAFERAEERFRAASRLRPGAPEPAAALAEVEVARTVATLRTLQRRGSQQLAQEEFDAAIATFEQALEIDGSLRFAREGLARARPRAAASEALAQIIEEPERLVDDAILREAQQALQRARALSEAGPKMNALIADAASTLEVAATPVEVTLRSDGETAVTVYKVARLGRFTEKQLRLRPGSYTAVGSRRGYRDVRREFTVTPAGLAAPVSIACSEPI